MSNPTELPDLYLDELETLCKNAPVMWYGTLQIADGVTDDNAALLIEACSPDTVAELVRLARRAQTERAQFDWMKAERIRDEAHVDEALRNFREDPTGDNATGIIQAALTVWAADVDVLAKPEGEAPQAEQAPSPTVEVFKLYSAVNMMMAHLGMHGEIDTRHETVDEVMNALHGLDGGQVAQRIEDLVEKAFMPKDQATRLAVSEYCTIGLAAAQHAESGAPHDLTIGEAFKAVGGWMNGGELGYPSFGSMEALKNYTVKMIRAHVPNAEWLAAQSQGAPTHCDPAEGFCAACREQERAHLAAQQAAAPGAALAILRDVHDTLSSESDSDIDHFEDDDEEREGAPVQYAARKVMEVMDMLKAAPSAPGTPEAPFQARVEPWMAACFGPRISADTTERNHRFIEEALELVQAGGMPKADVLQLVDYTYGRPIGELHQEVGGVMVTLAALCLAQGLDMHQAAEVELARIWTKVEAIREKQRTKPRGSPLPMDPRAAQLDGGQGEGEKA